MTGAQDFRIDVILVFNVGEFACDIDFYGKEVGEKRPPYILRY